MIDQFAAIYPHCHASNCFSHSTDDRCWIIDETGKSTFYTHPDYIPNFPYFNINNPNNKTVALFSIDKCILPDDVSKCDCAIHYEDKFCFIELKRGLDPNLLEEKKSDAVNQLRVTINTFLTRGINFGALIKEAYIAVGYQRSYPRANASNQDWRVEFWNDFEVDLYEGNQIDI